MDRPARSVSIFLREPSMHTSPVKRRRTLRDASRRLLPAVAALCMAGCISTPPLADLAPLEDVFPQAPAEAEYASIPQQAVKTAVYEAPFEDVFRLASVSASQAQLNVERVDRQGGVILATRATMMAPDTVMNGGELLPHRYYYVIRVKELESRRTEVRVAAKVQGTCRITGGKNRAILGVMSLGMSEVAGAGALFGAEDKACREVMTPRWAAGRQSTEPELANVQTFLRNHLLAQGLI